MIDANNAASSTAEVDAATAATVQALADNDFAQYEQIQNASEAGQAIPEATPASTPADKAPEAAAGTKVQEPKKPKTGEDRKAELEADIAKLLRTRAELQGKIPAADAGEKKGDPPPPAKAEPAKPAAAAAAAKAPVEPLLENFESYPLFAAAEKAYIKELVAFTAAEAVRNAKAEDQTAAANKVKEDAWNAQVATAKEEHADYAEVAFSKDTPISNTMDGFILKSPLGARVLYQLGLNGSAEAKRIFALDAYDQVEALITIRDSLGKPAAKKEAPVKIHSDAPAPATDLGARRAEPADSLKAAMLSGDFARYEREANAADAKALRG